MSFSRMVEIPRPEANEGSSCRRRPAGGFTFEVQQVTAENLCRGFVVKTLSRSVIIGTHQGEQALIGQRGQISFPRQSSAHASDGRFQCRPSATVHEGRRKRCASIVYGGGNGTRTQCHYQR